jgi:RHS repeat-associated protein
MHLTNFNFYPYKNYLYSKPVKGLRGYEVGYGFAFNGMERDDDISGNGNSYTTEFRQYDPRLGRWFGIDPEFKAFAWQSPYVAFDNNPISKTDPRGDAPGDGEKRAEKAKEIDKKDTRTYDSKSERKSGDTKVDCSEFATEVQNATGYTGGGTKEVPGKASVQAATFKATGEYSTKLKDVKLGDQVFFKKSGEINHTGIVSEIDKDGNIYVTHATVNGGKPGSIMTNKLNSDGSIPYWKNTFVGAGRPKLTQSTATLLPKQHKLQQLIKLLLHHHRPQ